MNISKSQLARPPALPFTLACGLLAGLLWGSLALAAPAVLAQQGSFSAAIQPLEAPGSAVNFYNYANFQAHTGLEQADHSLLFFYRDSLSGQLALVIIHSSQDGDPGGARFSISGLPPGSNLALKDDRNDSYRFTPPQAELLWFWDAAHSDGAVINNLGKRFNLTIQPVFKQGISEWDLLSARPDGSMRTIPLPNLDQPLTLSTTGQQMPLASFTFSPSSPQPFMPVHFDASGSQAFSGSRIVRYQWDFNGDGIYEESSDKPQISHSFATGGSRRVTLQVTDSSGLQGQSSRTLEVSSLRTTATRRISTPAAVPGSTFRVTIELTVLAPSNGLGLEEQWPPGWKIVAVRSDGAAFKERLRQWVFPSFLPAGTSKEIIYDVEVPPADQLQLRTLPAVATVSGSLTSVAPRYRVPVMGESQVEISSCLAASVAAAHLRLSDGQVDLRLDKLISAEQLKRVIGLWQNNEQLPLSCAGALSLNPLVEVVRRQLQAIPVDRPLPLPAADQTSPVQVKRVILTPLPFHQLYPLVEGGRTFRVELDVKADRDVYGLGLREELPAGWQLQLVAAPGAAFKPSQDEWLFPEVIAAGQFRTLVYQVTVPADQPVGSSLLRGIATLAPQGVVLNPIGGDNQVELVTCLSVPVAISHLNTKTGQIDLTLDNTIQMDQVQAAMNFWFDDAQVPGTCGTQLDLPTLQHLIDLAVSGEPIDQQKSP
ncbi:MAG TPA: PKD domain-containing protein [Candidatus Fraserbacteria bacterium]|nr:PKD domain-containing protein [Candidatus Fraserbacteria bacterium]